MNINYKDIQLNLEFKIANCIFETKQFTTFPFPSKNTGSLFFALVSFKLVNERLLFTVELLTENCSLFNPHFFYTQNTHLYVFILWVLYIPERNIEIFQSISFADSKERTILLNESLSMYWQPMKKNLYAVQSVLY